MRRTDRNPKRTRRSASKNLVPCSLLPRTHLTVRKCKKEAICRSLRMASVQARRSPSMSLSSSKGTSSTYTANNSLAIFGHADLNSMMIHASSGCFTAAPKGLACRGLREPVPPRRLSGPGSSMAAIGSCKSSRQEDVLLKRGEESQKPSQWRALRSFGGLRCLTLWLLCGCGMCCLLCLRA